METRLDQVLGDAEGVRGTFTATIVDGAPDTLSMSFDDYSASGSVGGGRITVNQ